MWSDWKPEEYEQDIKQMKALNMNLCRFFLFFPDFMPKENTVSPLMVQRLKSFLDICEKYKMGSMPSFFVGHMSGEDWDVDWRQGRSFITNQEMVKAEKKYIRTIVKETKHYENIQGWLLSNELPNYIDEPDPTDLAGWTEEIINTIKEVDHHRAVSIGDGAWTPEITSRDRGFQLRLLNNYQDFVGLHYYPRHGDSWEHSMTTAFRLRMAENWKRPVFVEEFGTSTTLCSEQNQANYYRSVFYSSLINNSFGAIGWCLNDFDFQDKRPYSHHPFEERFGVVKTNRSVKPAGQEFKKFSSIAQELYSDKYKKIENNIGLIIPSYYYKDYPYMFQPRFDKWYEFYLHCFTMIKRAGLEVECIFEPEVKISDDEAILPQSKKLDPGQFPVLFAPRLKLFTKKYWMKIVEYVKKGGILYTSFANDSWVLDWPELTGIEMDCKFGVPDYRQVSALKISPVTEWGSFKEEDDFTIPLKQNQPEASYCKILNNNSKVIMEDQFGHPALLKNDFGQGQVYFASYPLEILTMKSDLDQGKKNVGSVYKSIYKKAFEHRPVEIVTDGMEIGIWENRQNGENKVIIFNHSWKKNTGVIQLHKNSKIKSENIELHEIADRQYKIILERKQAGVFNIKKTQKGG